MGAPRSSSSRADRRSSLPLGLGVGAALATGCMTIAGLDGDYALGDPFGGATATAGGGVGASGAAGGTTSSGGSTTTAGGSGGGTTTTGGGFGGSGGEGGDDAVDKLLESLDGLRLEYPCLDGGSPYCTTAGDLQVTADAAGAPGATYDVAVRLQGVLETNTYQGGTQSGQLYIGGDHLGGWNIYGLKVSDPPQSYFVNNGTCCHAYCVEIDIQTTIQVATGATVTLWGDDRENLSTRNMDQDGLPIVISGVPSAPDDGQFIQLNTLSAAPH